MDLVVGEFGLFGIDHEDHVRDPFGVFVDDEAFIGNGLFGAKSVRLSVHGWECWNGSVEDEFHGHISPVLSAGDGTAGIDRRACDQGSPFHISKYQESGKVGKQ